MFVEPLIAFCQFLRQRGCSPGLQQTIDAMQGAKLVNPAERATLKAALKAILCSSKEDWDVFDGLFEQFWTGRINPLVEKESDQSRTSKSESNRPAEFTKFVDNADTDSTDGHLVAGASAESRLRKADFSTVAADDLAELDRLAARLLSLMGRRVSRSFRGSKTRGRLDLRATLRRSVPVGGTPLDLRWKGMRPRPLELVILLDVSGSMNPYTLFLVRFAYALQKHFKRVSTFLFSTHIQEITRELRTRQLREALARLSKSKAGWAGGTRIGESLRTFLNGKGRRLLTRRSVVLILSDGWDTGHPEVLASQVAAIQRRARKLIWLSPLLGLDDYQPLTRALSAALPFVDVFAAANNLESLLELERHLHVRSISK